MKANQALSNLLGLGTLLSSGYQPLANYFVKFIQAYASNGIPISAITAQKEPRAGTQYPGMNLPEANEATFIAGYLRPALNSAGLGPKNYGLDGSSLPYAQALLGSQARSSSTESHGMARL